MKLVGFSGKMVNIINPADGQICVIELDERNIHKFVLSIYLTKGSRCDCRFFDNKAQMDRWACENLGVKNILDDWI